MKHRPAISHQYLQNVSPIAVLGVFPIQRVDSVDNTRAAVNVKVLFTTGDDAV